MHRVALCCRILGGIVAAVACALSVGCSTFNRDWNRLAAGQTSLQAHDDIHEPLVGRWQGEWRSNKNGHHGGLRCIISEDQPGELHARYHATYGWFFTFEYDMLMAAEADEEGYRFAATADLGWLAGGAYEYAGTVRGDVFHATYQSSGDHGTFEMMRVMPASDDALSK